MRRMIIGNIIIFAFVIVVVCAVDLSTLSLDESAERLLYREEETESQEEDKVIDSMDDTILDGSNFEMSSTDDVLDAVEAMDNVMEKADVQIGASIEREVSEKVTASNYEESDEDFSDLNDFIEQNIQKTKLDENFIGVPNLSGISQEEPTNVNVLKQVSRNRGKKNGATSRTLTDDELGMSADFEDDFLNLGEDPADLLRQIHEEGFPS